MEWIPLTTEEQLAGIIDQSFQKPVVIFKHSTRCSISSMAMNRIESKWNVSKEEAPIYYLDLIVYREISNRIADQFDVRHESPQVLVISNGKCVFNASHNAVDVSSIKDALAHQ